MCVCNYVVAIGDGMWCNVERLAPFQVSILNNGYADCHMSDPVTNLTMSFL